MFLLVCSSTTSRDGGAATPGLVLGAWLVLRRAGLKGAAVAGRIGLVFGGVVLVAAAGIGAVWLMRPLVNANGPTPRLVFEIGSAFSLISA